MEEADGDRLDAVGDRRGGGADRLDLGAGGVEAAVDLQPQVAGDEGLGPVGPLVVERRPVLAGDLDHVGEAPVGDEGDDRPPPFEEGVGGDGRPVGQQLGAALAAMALGGDGPGRGRRACSTP